jgi:hypothetical protein
MTELVRCQARDNGRTNHAISQGILVLSSPSLSLSPIASLWTTFPGTFVKFCYLCLSLLYSNTVRKVLRFRLHNIPGSLPFCLYR